MNLLVGVNGVGKTTVLDALRICVSKMLPAVTASRSRPIPFVAEDIRGKAAAMTVRLFLELEKRDFEFLVHKQREHSVAHKAGEVRQQTRNTPDQETCTPGALRSRRQSEGGGKTASWHLLLDSTVPGVRRNAVLRKRRWRASCRLCRRPRKS